MVNVTARPGHEVLDVIGVGFGPSNLGLAIALEEHNATAAPEDRITARFVERQEKFGWHRGMLLEDATMQVSFLKDLVTIRNPTSSFSFVSYLKERERLVDFINYGSNFPTRLEFHDYLEWAASRFTDRVDYGAEVEEIVPVRGEGGAVDQVEVTYRRDGRTVRLRARNVVLATGLTAALPRGITAGARIWHNKDLLHRAPHLVDSVDSRSADAPLGADARSADAPLGAPKRMAVIGAGQSAAETVEYLHRTFPEAEVYAVFARYGYSPADDSSFANRIFDPGAVDDFYTAPDGVKEMILGYHANTNYSVVDPELIDGLYRTHYHERVAGRERLKFCNVSRVADVVEVDDRVELAVESLIDGEREVITADVVVYATGYRAGDPLWLLGGGLPEACGRDVAGRLDVRRDYRVGTEALADGTPVTAGIYLQGPTEHTHGISSTLLSNVAVRSGEIAGSIVTGGASASGRPAGAPATDGVAAELPGVAHTGR